MLDFFNFVFIASVKSVHLAFLKLNLLLKGTLCALVAAWIYKHTGLYVWYLFPNIFCTLLCNTGCYEFENRVLPFSQYPLLYIKEYDNLGILYKC